MIVTLPFVQLSHLSAIENELSEHANNSILLISQPNQVYNNTCTEFASFQIVVSRDQTEEKTTVVSRYSHVIGRYFVIPWGEFSTKFGCSSLPILESSYQLLLPVPATHTYVTVTLLALVEFLTNTLSQ
jgi:hypothetical protein